MVIVLRGKESGLRLGLYAVEAKRGNSYLLHADYIPGLMLDGFVEHLSDRHQQNAVWSSVASPFNECGNRRRKQGVARPKLTPWDPDEVHEQADPSCVHCCNQARGTGAIAERVPRDPQGSSSQCWSPHSHRDSGKVPSGGGEGAFSR